MFSFNFDIGWGIVAIVLGIFGFGLYLFIGFNIIAYDIAQRQGRLPKPNVVVLPVSGIIRYNVRPGSGFQKLVRQIEWIRKNKPKAVILRINSPGGSTGATHELYESLKNAFVEGKEWEQGEWSGDELARAKELVESRYSTDEWNGLR